MHNRSINNSEQLQKAMALLSDYRPHTTLEIERATGSVCTGTLISELRHNDVPVSDAEYIGLTDGKNKVYQYRLIKKELDRYMLSECECGKSSYTVNGKCNKCGRDRSREIQDRIKAAA